MLRPVSVALAAGSGLLLFASPAFAQDCLVGVHSTKAPVSSNWGVVTAADAAAQFGGFTAACPAQTAAGYAALKAAQLPSSVKSRTDMTLASRNDGPAMSDGHGLDHFESSPLPGM